MINNHSIGLFNKLHLKINSLQLARLLPNQGKQGYSQDNCNLNN